MWLGCRAAARRAILSVKGVIARATVRRIIDLGPEGGVKGGEIVAVETPEDVVRLYWQVPSAVVAGRDGKVKAKREAVAAE